MSPLQTTYEASILITLETDSTWISSTMEANIRHVSRPTQFYGNRTTYHFK